MSVPINRLQLRKDLCEILKSDYVALLGQRGSGSKTLVKLITANESPLPGMKFIAVALPQGEQNSDLFMEIFLNNLIGASTQIPPQPELVNKVRQTVNAEAEFPIIFRVRRALDILGRTSTTNYLVIVLHALADVSEQPLKDLLLLLREYHTQIGILNLGGEKLRFLVVGSTRLWNLCCHKPSDSESPFNISKRVFIRGLSYQEVQSKFKELGIEQAVKLKDLTDGVPSLVELISKETEDFEDLSGCFDPLEDSWNSLSFPAQQALKNLVVELPQKFPSCKLDNQCLHIAKFEDSIIWQEVFWRGFFKLRHRKLTWRSPVHQAFVMTQAQIETDMSKSTLLRSSFLERVESLEETLKGLMSARTLAECTEELVSLSVHSGNAELVPLLEMLLERKQRDIILMELKNVAAKSQKQWIKDLTKLTTVPPGSFNKLLIDAVVGKVANDMQEVPTNSNTINQTAMNYHDFQILVTEDRKIRASSEQGDEWGKMQLDMNRIKLTLKLIEQRQTDADLLKGLGSELYQALFPMDVRGQLRATIAGAQAHEYNVRLRLVFESSELAALPWEFLYDERTNTFLANNTETVLSRYIDIPLQKRDLKTASLPLKILLVISSPTNLAQLDVAEEEHLIREALAIHIQAGKIELDVLQEATIRNINQKLREKPYNVFHFIGHAVFESNKGSIALVDTNGKYKLLDDEGFANFFLGNHNLGLAVLNSCQGAAVSSQQVFAGIAPNLVRRGIPAVVAMQYSILDTTAKLFADEFYRTLALGWPVDAAIQTTRNAISMEVGLDKCDFATPVLYMRAKDGIILSGL